MKKLSLMFILLAGVISTTLAVATNTYHIGGDSAVRDRAWNQVTSTNTSVTPTEYTYRFVPPEIYPDLSNVVITVTAVETNDIMFIQSTHLAGTNGVSGRLDGDEAILLTVSYADPDGLLTGLKVDSFGPWWGTGANEETLFSDGTTVYAMQDIDNGVMADYDSTGLTQLTLANTGTWSMLVYQTNNLTESGLGGFKLEYIANVDLIILPPDPPHGVVELNDTWQASRCIKLAEASDFCSAIFTNNVDGENNTNRRFVQTAFPGAPVQVGDTLNISFTAKVGDNLPVNGADRIFRASFWDDGATAANGFSFRADYGAAYGGTTLEFGLGNVQSQGYVGTLSSSVTTTNKPTNRLENHGDEVDIMITIERTGDTTADCVMSYDNVVVSNSFTGVNNFDSLEGIGFRMNSVSDNHLIITNLQIEVTNDTFDWFNDWAFWALLEEGVNDGYDDDPDFDTMNNLLEYALDGDPLVADAWRQPTSTGLTEDGGTNYLNMIYRRRRDAETRRLTYLLGSANDLILDKTTNATVEVGSEVINGRMEFVTNRVSTAVEDQQFLQLRITQD